MKHLRLTSLAAAIAFFGIGVTTASATVHNLGALSLGNTSPTGAITAAGKAPKPFSDTWDFTVLAPADLILSTVFNFNQPKKQNIIGLHLSLFEGIHQLAISGFGTGATGESESIPTTRVFPGHFYDFLVTGTLPAHDTGVYDLNIFVSTIAVPELSSWAMMLIGFAGVGLQIRRRRSAVSLTA